MMSIVFWSLWRRLYGEGTFKKTISRTSQTITAVLMLTYQLKPEWTWQEIGIAFGVSIWVVIQYWSRAIGEIIDAGLNHQQTKESYARWFRIPLDLIYDILGKRKYIGFYDFWYASIRYTIGALPLFYYSYWAVLLIPFQYVIYLECHKLYVKYPNMYGLPFSLCEPKNLAEIIHGALFGLTVGLM